MTNMNTKQPNILLITSDQHHPDVLGAVNPQLRTPHLDRLCREGVRFERAYTCNPTCTPARASIITGMYPSQHGAWSLGTKLFEDVPTLGGYLQAAGYDTSLVGKAHFQPMRSRPGMESIESQPTLRDLDFWRTFRGPWYGFEHVETARMHTAESHAGGHYAIWMEEKGLANWKDYFEDWPYNAEKKARIYSSRTWALPQEYHYNTWTSEKSLERLRAAAAAQKPFFLWLSFHDPHPPYLVPEPWASMYNPADMTPGRLTPGEHDANPAHFRHTQDQDHSWWKGANEGEGPYLVDLAPTFLAAASVEIPGLMTGLNLLPDWCDGQPMRTWLITENHHGRRRFHMRTYVNERYKLTVYRTGHDGELFDLVADAGELRNLWHDPAAQAVKTQMMEAFLQATLEMEPERMPRISGA